MSIIYKTFLSHTQDLIIIITLWCHYNCATKFLPHKKKFFTTYTLLCTSIKYIKLDKYNVPYMCWVNYSQTWTRVYKLDFQKERIRWDKILLHMENVWCSGWKNHIDWLSFKGLKVNWLSHVGKWHVHISREWKIHSKIIPE